MNDFITTGVFLFIIIISVLATVSIFLIQNLFEEFKAGQLWFRGQLLIGLGISLTFLSMLIPDYRIYYIDVILPLWGLILFYNGFEQFFKLKITKGLYVLLAIFIIELLVYECFDLISFFVLQLSFFIILTIQYVIHLSLLFFRTRYIGLKYKIIGILAFGFLLLVTLIRVYFIYMEPTFSRDELDSLNLMYWLVLCLSQLLFPCHILLLMLERVGAISIIQVFNQNAFMRILSHDLQSSIGRIISLCRLERSKQHNGDGYAVTIETYAVNAHHLINNLFHWVNKRKEGLNLASYVDLAILINRNINLFTFELRNKNIQINLDVNKRLLVLVDESVLETIVRNVISNAIKFSYKDTSIDIEFGVEQNTAFISVIDYGIGITDKKISELLNEDQMVVSTIGTSGEKGSGLGFGIILKLIKILKGDIGIFNGVKGQTEVKIEFPVSPLS